MKKAVVFFLFLGTLISCVPVAKYQKAQNNLQDLREQNFRTKSQFDSLHQLYRVLRSDYNSLSYDMSETEKYALFSDKEAIRELNREKIELQKTTEILNQLRNQVELARKMPLYRAQAFATDAQCSLGGFTRSKFILVNQNIITIDIESLMAGTKDRQPELKISLVNLFHSLSDREDVVIAVSLYQSAMSSDWSKVNGQQEIMGFLVTEAALPAARVVGLTKIVTKEKSPEFGISTNSRLLLELEFKG